MRESSVVKMFALSFTNQVCNVHVVIFVCLLMRYQPFTRLIIVIYHVNDILVILMSYLRIVTNYFVRDLPLCQRM